jgi:T5SS/PEP-CTERM-associated repeat protein
MIPALCLACARGDTLVWVNQNGGAFSDQANWAQNNGASNNHVPGAGDTACIANHDNACGPGGVVSVDAPITVNGGAVDVLGLSFATFSVSGTFSASAATFGSATLTGGGTLSAGAVTALSLTMAGATLNTSGQGVFSDLTISQGSVSTASAVIGNIPILIDGGGSSWNSGALTDSGGGGFVTIQNGGKLTSAGTEIDYSSFTVTGTGSAWNLSQLTVGLGRFVVTNNGTINSGEAFFGSGSPAGTAEITLDGAGSSWGFGSALHLGYNAASTVLMHLKNGAILPLAHNTTIGESGYASVDIQSGAQIQESGADTPFGLGNNAGSEGGVLVSGSGSLLKVAGPTIAGINGNGSLGATAGGTIQTEGLRAGGATGSQGYLSVDGAGSTFTVQPTLEVGYGGNGQLSVSSNGMFHVASGLFARCGVGWNSGGTGLVLVSDPGSLLLVDAIMIIGLEGTGTVDVTSGGTVHTGTLDLGGAPGSSGSILIFGMGSSWTNDDNVFVGGNPSSQPAGTGNITINNNAIMNVAHTLGVSATGSITLDQTGRIAVGSGGYGPGGTLRVSQNGKLLGRGVVHGKVIHDNGGVVAPGYSPGTFTIDGAYQQESGGVLEIEIAGINPGSQYDVLNVSGAVNLGGTLSLIFTNGFAPKAGQTFRFLQFGTNTLSGTFGQVSVSGLASGFQYQLHSEAAGSYSLVALNNGTATSPPLLSLLAANPPFWELSWPDTAVGYLLQSTTNLSTGVWVNEPISTNTFLFSPSAKAQFFRLFKP